VIASARPLVPGGARRQGQRPLFGAKNVLFEAYPYSGSSASLKSPGFHIQTMYPTDSTGTPA
jgi:hypothetical protein